MPLQGTVILDSRVLAQTCVCVKSHPAGSSAIVCPLRICSAPLPLQSSIPCDISEALLLLEPPPWQQKS